MRSDYERQFVMTMNAELGLEIKEVTADGTIQRCGIKGKENGKDGAYVFHPARVPYGWGWNWFSGESCHWRADSDAPMTPEEIREQERALAEVKKEREMEYAKAGLHAQRLIDNASTKVNNHLYMFGKGIEGAGPLRVDGMNLLVPLYGIDHGMMHKPLKAQSMQFIAPNGDKRFIKGGKVKGGFFPIGMEKLTGVVYIAEGAATGISVHHATGQPVFCALCGWNLKYVAAEIRRLYPDREIVIAGDDDQQRDGNPGRKYAQEAAIACDGRAVFPSFSDPEDVTELDASDFNDLHVYESLDEVKRQLEAKPFTPPDTSGPDLVAYNFEDFMDMDIPPQAWLLWPLMTDQALVMLYGPRGLGKTYVALTIALTAAKSGTVFGRWVAEKARKVLYLDGEMSAVQMQERLRMLAAAMNGPLPDPNNLRIITPDLQDGPMPDLSSPQGQAMVDAHLDGVDLLIIDNLSSLCLGGEENSSESWKMMQRWLAKLKSSRTSVLIVHHAGKNGQQRGTSKKEDALDTVVALKKPADYDPEQGARVEVHFEKARGFSGEDAKAFCAQLFSDEDGRTSWEVSDYHNEQLEAVTELMDAGLSVRAIAEELDIPKSTAHRLMKQAKAA